MTWAMAKCDALICICNPSAACLMQCWAHLKMVTVAVAVAWDVVFMVDVLTTLLQVLLASFLQTFKSPIHLQ